MADTLMGIPIYKIIGNSNHQDGLKRNSKYQDSWSVFDLVDFVALRPKSTAMVIAGRSVHLTTLFPGQA